MCRNSVKPQGKKHHLIRAGVELQVEETLVIAHAPHILLLLSQEFHHSK